MVSIIPIVLNATRFHTLSSAILNDFNENVQIVDSPTFAEDVPNSTALFDRNIL